MINSTMSALLRMRDAAFRSGDKQAHSKARGKLQRGTEDAKSNCKQSIEEQFNNNSPLSMSIDIKSLTDYNSNHRLPNKDTEFTDVLNHFFARFHTQRVKSAPHTNLPAGVETLVLQQHEVRATLRKINAHKAACPDGVAARVLKTC